MMLYRFVSIAAVGLATVVHAQSKRTFAKPDLEFAEPFSLLTSLRELRDGRVIVIDSRENQLQVVDFVVLGESPDCRLACFSSLAALMPQ